MAHGGEGLLAHGLHGGVVAGVHHDGDDLAAGLGGDLGGGGVQPVLGAGGQHDVGALLGELDGDGLADAAAAAGDERYLPFELQVHGASLSCSGRPAVPVQGRAALRELTQQSMGCQRGA